MTKTKTPEWEDITRPDFTRGCWCGRPRGNCNHKGKKDSPLIIPPKGGNRIAYKRATTFIDAIEDKWFLQQWDKRQVAIGLSRRRDLIQAVQANLDDKTELDRICYEAKQAAASDAGATTGSSWHKFTDLIDKGKPLPEGIDPDVVESLEAYRTATAPLKVHDIEAHLVNDPWKIAGTTDRILSFRRQRYIGDLKTQKTIELGTGKIAGQLAIYARSRPYNVVTDERGGAHGCSTRWGLVIWLPADQPGVCELHWFDLMQGWEWVKESKQVRELRKVKFDQWTRPFDPDTSPEKFETPAGGDAPDVPRASAERQASPPAGPLHEAIRACRSRDEVTALWRKHKAAWTEEHTAAAEAQIATFKEAS